MMMQAYDAEDAVGCCRRIAEAMRKGQLDDADRWECPKCGLEWRPSSEHGIRFWRARPVVTLLPHRQRNL